MRMDDDLVAKYAAEAKAAMEAEAARRVAESTDPEEEERLRNTSLHELLDSQHLVPALLARLGAVRAALDGHGGGIAVSLVEHHEEAVVLGGCPPTDSLAGRASRALVLDQVEDRPAAHDRVQVSRRPSSNVLKYVTSRSFQRDLRRA